MESTCLLPSVSGVDVRVWVPRSKSTCVSVSVSTWEYHSRRCGSGYGPMGTVRGSEAEGLTGSYFNPVGFCDSQK